MIKIKVLRILDKMKFAYVHFQNNLNMDMQPLLLIIRYRRLARGLLWGLKVAKFVWAGVPINLNRVLLVRQPWF